jgi:hypothetical protein
LIAEIGQPRPALAQKARAYLTCRIPIKKKNQKAKKRKGQGFDGI